MTRKLSDGDRDILRDCETDARPVGPGDDHDTEAMDADAFGCWFEDEPESPPLPPIDCHDPVDERDLPY